MPVFLLGLCLAFLSCASQEVASPGRAPPAVEVSPAELAEFGLTRYTDKEKFPLGGLSTADGKPYDPAVLSGKYVFLNLWATWCPYCAEEKPSIQRLYDECESGGFTVLTVSLGETAETVREYMESNGYGFPVLLNADNSLREAYAPRIPATYILDAGGRIIARVNGNRDWSSGQAARILKFAVKGF
jgi:thiol-disulfide isomerase/thioredoxin